MRIKFIFSVCLLFSIYKTAFSQSYDYEKATKWVDSVFTTLTVDQRIGQLFMVAAYSNRDSAHIRDISRLVRNYHIGGLCFFQGGPVRQALQCNYYQSQAKVPLLVSMDAEWGLSMRLDSTIRYPKQMALGAISDNKLIYEFGKEVARQCKRLGVHLNFAPVVDVNNNPRNPVINDRSFGEDKYKVAAKAIEYMRGMQDNGVLANAKHFPGHGNTDKDSHYTLPVITRSRQEIDSLELYPFKELMKRGLSSVMVAHLNIPSLDNTKNMPSTLSKNVVTDLLKKQLNFEGLVFTDALNMKGVSSYFAPGVVDVKALLAGNDVLLLSENVPIAIVEIKKAISAKQIDIEEIDKRVKKILLAKYIVGLNNYQPAQIEGLYEDLNSNEAKLLSMKLYENALTLLANKNNLIPLTNLDQRDIAVVSIGADSSNEFLEMCKNYASVYTFSIKKDASLSDFEFLEENLTGFNTVIIAIHDMSRSEAKNFSISMQTRSFLSKVSKFPNVGLVVFGNAYSLRNFDNIAPIILTYEENDYTRSLAAQLIFGGISVNGSLPVTASATFKCGGGFTVKDPIRFKYTMPEEVGINTNDLNKIDAIVQKAIEAKATPGCQVLVAKEGKIIYSKSFGKHAYASESPKVINSDLYDLASLTKILATNLVMMKMYDEGELDLKAKLAHYVPSVRSTNKQNILIGDLLTHQAGLRPFIPFWKSSLSNEKNGQSFYNVDSINGYALCVAQNMYLSSDYEKKIWSDIYLSEMKEAGKYVYSDLSFYLLKQVADNYTKTSFDLYLDATFYRPLGLSTMTFNPLCKFSADRIAPTENDTLFRMQLLDGYVHDQGAAMLGGVAGHAGLFSNANDVAIIMQMLLNKGHYGGVNYFKPKTVDEFTKAHYPKNRRGLGFDKPEPDSNKPSPTAKSAPLSTFGHTGFTGTCTWVDPENQLVYVFLSNRIHPSVDNKKLIEMGVRTEIQQAIYNALTR